MTQIQLCFCFYKLYQELYEISRYRVPDAHWRKLIFFPPIKSLRKFKNFSFKFAVSEVAAHFIHNRFFAMPRKSKQKRFRNFTVTDFELNQDFWDAAVQSKKIKYAYAGREVCPSTGRTHWQMFVCFTNQISVSAARKFLAPRHIECMRGSLDANEAYCSKDGDIAFELGTKPSQGERTDLRQVADDIKAGKRVRDILTENPVLYHKYGRTMERLEDAELSRIHRTTMTEGLWLHGPTGTGKSHEALKDYDPDTHYIHPVRDNGWWDGYRQQPTVVINDFRGEIPYAEMLQLVDKWPHHVPRRCREPIPFTSSKVIVTSSQAPEEVYNRRAEEDSIQQLLRRFEVKECLTKYN